MAVWAEVRDKVTGHHYDVTLERLELLLERGGVEEVPGRRHRGAPRPAKIHRPKGASPAATVRKAVKPKAQTVAEEKESES